MKEGRSKVIVSSGTGGNGKVQNDDVQASVQMIHNIEVEFEDSKCQFKLNISTTFDQLLEESARYFGIDKDDCFFTDISGGVWPAEGVVQYELGKLTKIPVLRMLLKPVVLGLTTKDIMEEEEEETADVHDDEPSPDEIRRVRFQNLYTDPPRRKIIIELIWFIVFIAMFIAVSQARRSTLEINTVITALQTAFSEANFGEYSEKTYNDISSEADMWEWIQGPLTDGLFPDDGKVMSYGKVVGAIELRQYRVNNRSCTPDSATRYDGPLDYTGYLVDECFGTFSSGHQDTIPFGPSKGNWTGCTPSAAGVLEKSKTCIPGEYCNGLNTCTGCPDSKLFPDCLCPEGRIDTYPNCLCPVEGQEYPCIGWGNVNKGYCCYDGFMLRPKVKGEISVDISGSYGTYPVGSYKIALGTSQAGFQYTVDQLMANNWIDRQTRAIVLQFVIFNPNYRSYAVCQFLFELNISGLMVPFPAKYNVLNLEIFEWTKNKKLFVLEIVLWVFMARFVTTHIVGDMRLVWKGYRSIWPYFRVMWNWIDILILLVIGLTYLLRVFFLLDKNRRKFDPFSSSYTDLTTATYLNALAFRFDAVAVLLMFFKFFKYFALNKKMGVLWKTLIRSVGMLYGFIFLYFLLLMAFVFMANIVFGTKLEGFSTIPDSLTTLLLYLMGDFDFDSLYDADEYWGPILFIFYTVMMYLILLNVFVSILSEAYATESENLKVETQASKKMARRTAGEIYRFAVLAAKDWRARGKINRIRQKRKKQKEIEMADMREKRKAEVLNKKADARAQKAKQKAEEEKKLKDEQAKANYQKTLEDKAAGK
eukprot:c7595_g1_i2.p1 GENE.c7595_g1_i2~~c7595_g1_i2.p1  ORF type:complete len:940 (-),score=221.03 c7595_g1_i2:48-2498(-)